MKIIITLLSFSVIILIGLASALTNAGGSPGGKTGSPGDGNNCTQCHGGTAQIATAWVIPDMPFDGYVPGETYTITATGTHAGVVRFGFELTAENSNHAKVGTFTITNTAETKLVNSGKAVSHTGNGFTPSGNSKSWSCNWTAPAAGAGDVIFYGAFNAANGDMSTSGDVIYLSNYTVNEKIVGIQEASNLEDQISLFPTMAENTINLTWDNQTVKQIIIYNINGKQLINKIVNSSDKSIKIDVSSLSAGTYFCNCDVAGQTVVKRFLVK